MNVDAKSQRVTANDFLPNAPYPLPKGRTYLIACPEAGGGKLPYDDRQVLSRADGIWLNVSALNAEFIGEPCRTIR